MMELSYNKQKLEDNRFNITKGETKIFNAIYSYMGNKVERHFFLPSEKDVRSEILKLGGAPLFIKEYKSSISVLSGNVSIDYGLKLLRAIRFHINSGVSPGKSLSICIEAESDIKKRSKLQRALDVIYGGGMFSDAMDQLKIFNKTVIAILRSGEETGRMNEAILSAIEYLESSKKNWRLLVGGFGWVSFDFFSAISSVVGMQYGLLPWLEKNGMDANNIKPEIIEKFNTALKQTYFINGILLWGTIFVLVIAITILFLYWLGKSPGLRKFIDNLLIKIPIIRNVIFDGALSDSFSLVGRMLQSRVPMIKAMTIASESSYVPGVKSYWDKVKYRIHYGDTVSKAMYSNLLSKSEIMELETHQDTDQLATIILNIAEERNYQFNNGIKRLIKWAIFFTIAYTVLVIGLAMRVVMLQNEGLSQTMKGIGGI